jgi:hypothetical protein
MFSLMPRLLFVKNKSSPKSKEKAKRISSFVLIRLLKNDAGHRQWKGYRAVSLASIMTLCYMDMETHQLHQLFASLKKDTIELLPWETWLYKGSRKVTTKKQKRNLNFLHHALIRITIERQHSCSTVSSRLFYKITLSF